MIKLFPVAQRNSDVEDAFGPGSIEVEMGSNANGRGAYSRGALTRETLAHALNPFYLRAAREYLMRDNPAFRNAPDSSLVHPYLLLPGRPWERFTFSGLRRLMVEQLIPTQIAWRVSADERDLRTVIYFSPTELKVFGLP